MEELALQKSSQLEKKIESSEGGGEREYIAMEENLLEGVDKNSVAKGRMKKIFCVLTALAAGTLAIKKEAVAGVYNGEKSLAKQSGEVEVMDKKSEAEKFAVKEFVEEIKQIDSQSGEVEMEAAVMTALSRLDLFLSTNRGANADGGEVVRQKAKDVLSRYQELLKKELSGKEDETKLKIIEELLGNRLSLE